MSKSHHSLSFNPFNQSSDKKGSKKLDRVENDVRVLHLQHEVGQEGVVAVKSLVETDDSRRIEADHAGKVVLEVAGG